MILFQLRSINMVAVAIFAILSSKGLTHASNYLGKCTKGSALDEKNRDNKRPEFPLQEDLRIKSSFIYKAHEILRNGLEEFLEFKNHMDLGFYLNIMTQNNSTYYDENGKIISSYSDVWSSIWKQYNETLCENYATKQFENDKLDLCSVARYLSHQLQLKFRPTVILETTGVALKIKRCDLCLSYNRNQPGETISCPSPLLDPSFDYAPCNISDGNVVCDQVPLKEIHNIFLRTSFPILASVRLILQPFIFGELVIPKDVFGTKRILDIWIEYPYNETLVDSTFLSLLHVDTDAFRSTKIYTNSFKINMIDCNLLNLGFLSGFDKLTHLDFDKIYNIQHCLPSLPPLPRLTMLHIEYCTGLNELIHFPTLVNGLKDVRFLGDLNCNCTHKDINDETADRIIDWLLLSSANTLEDLSISYMIQVTRVPPKIASFKALRSLHLNRNTISTIKYGAFSFSVPVSLLGIFGNGIKEIEPGAFQGNFKDAEVYVNNNNLARFEESVFGPILQQMVSGKGFVGGAYDAGNPIDCSNGNICHLNWLRRYQGKNKFWLKCSNGTLFEDLQPAGFNQCSNSSFDSAPCFFFDGGVVCDQVSLKEVQRVFNRTSFLKLASVKLVIQPYLLSERSIPKDVFGKKQIAHIWIEYPTEVFVNLSLSLKVHPNAFRSTKRYTEIFTINRIDCTVLDLGFLTGFDKLTNLTFGNIHNIQHCLPSLPPLSRLTSLDFEFSTGLNELHVLPTLKNGLKTVQFFGSTDNIQETINDATADRIMDWLLLSSANTLEEMTIVNMNQVTQVPHKISSFKALRALKLHGNSISVIKSGAFSFSVPVSELNIKENGIKEIESGAFQGDFKDAGIFMYNNNLTRFEESVFGPMLKQMASGNGFISASGENGNSMDCSEENICHLAWLRRYKAGSKFHLNCANGTLFEYLQPVGFNHCP